MKNPIEDGYSGMAPEESQTDIPVTSREAFVNNVYSMVDEATASGLDRLRREKGIVPTCKAGCYYCCRYHILTNIAEAHTLGQYIKRELSAEQIDNLRKRTQQWHEWDDSRPRRYPSAAADRGAGLSDYEHYCPLLVDNTCIAYPVRPVACRTHFASSPSTSCRAVNDPESTEDTPVVLTSLVAEASAFSTAIRDHIEDAGIDFSRSIMLLPHWLAIEMGWDFAISP